MNRYNSQYRIIDIVYMYVQPCLQETWIFSILKFIISMLLFKYLTIERYLL